MQQGPPAHPHRSHNAHAVHGVAVVLLTTLAALHYGWAAFPPQYQAGVWNVSGAVARLILLAMVVWHVRSWIVLCIAGWWAIEESMVAVCNVAYIVSPWPRGPGEAMCSSLLAFDLGKVGAFVLVAIAVALRCQPVRPDRSRDD